MKTILQRFFLICIIAMQVQNILAYDFEVDGIYYNKLSDSTVKVTYGGVQGAATDSYTGSITIPSTVVSDGITYDVTSIGEYAFRKSSVTSIVIPDGVTSIGKDAFFLCSSLTSITIPDGVTSIGNDAFRDCSGLTSINIPDGVTSIVSYTFSGCSGLTSITIPDGVTSIEEDAFHNCRSLTSINIPDGVTSIGDCAFDGCSGLTSITIPDGVTSIGDVVFRGCANLAFINVGEENQYYKSYEGVLYNKSMTTLIAYPGGGSKNFVIPDGVTSIGNSAFEGCSSLTSITIPDGVMRIKGFAFYGCSSLTSMTIPDGIKWIEDHTFHDCSGLTSITIGNDVTYIGNNAFYNCSSLTSITIPDGVTSIGNSAFYGCSGLTKITIGTNVTSIGECAFQNCTSVKRILCKSETPPACGTDALTGISRTSCTLFVPETSVTKYKETAPWSEIPYMAYFTYVLDDSTLVRVCDFEIDGICYAYAGKTDANGKYSEVNVTYKKITTELLEGNSTRYTGSSNYVGDVTIPSTVSYEGTEYKVTGIGNHAFWIQGDIKSVTIPNSVTHIDYSAFCDCHNLVTVTIPNSVTTIGNFAFSESGIEYITIPETVTNIGMGLFQWCSKLHSVSLPQNTTRIEQQMFNGCTSLTSITIPEHVTHIGSMALAQSGLMEIKCKSNTPPVCDVNALYKISRTDCILYVPEIGVSSYKETAPWSEFSNIVYFTDCDFEVDGICYAYAGEPDANGKYSEVNVSFKKSTTKEDEYGIINYTFNSYYSGYVTIPSTVSYEGNEYEVTGIGANAFRSQTNLKNVAIPNSVTHIYASAFRDCDSLITITIPNSVTAIEDFAFMESGIEYITVPETVSNIGIGLFQWCSKLCNVNLPQNITGIERQMFYGCKNLTNITIPEGVTYIGKDAFRATGLMEIKLPESLATIEESAFGSCSFKEITIPKNVTYMDFAFTNCKSLKKAIVLGSNIGNNAFWYCDSLESVIFGEGVTSIGDYDFSCCGKLGNIQIPSSVTSIGKGAFYMTGIKEITIPDGVTSIEDFTFQSCKNLTDITLPKDLTSIGEQSFSYCTNLTDITIPSSVTEVGRCAFYGCTSLKTITIERPAASEAKENGGKLRTASTTQTTIGAQAFAECTELTTAVLSEQVTSVGNEAFLNDSKLSIIYLLSTTPPTFGNDWIKGVADDCVIYVPEGSEYEYKGAGLSDYTVKGCYVTDINAVESVADENDIVSVYGLDGKCLYSGKHGEMHLSPGLYVVKSATSVRKIVVK